MITPDDEEGENLAQEVAQPNSKVVNSLSSSVPSPKGWVNPEIDANGDSRPSSPLSRNQEKLTSGHLKV